MDRVREEILSSPCFSEVKHANKDFLAFTESKIVPIEGDLTADGLGLTPEVKEMLIQDCHIVISCAATVNFDEHFHDALSINYYGAKKMLELSKQMKHLEVFNHISTCYVNANRPHGDIKEEVYDVDEDVEARATKLMGMSRQYIIDNTDRLLAEKGYPNTYTFTKSMSEKILAQLRGDVNLVICRPAVVFPSLVEPTPGWMDNFGGAVAVTWLAVNGATNNLNIPSDNIGDLVPVDLVSNGIIISTAYGAREKGCLQVYNQGSGGANEMRMGYYWDQVAKVCRYMKLNQ